MTDSLDLGGRVALAIGGSGGIGGAIGRGFAKAGAKVAVASRNGGKVEEAVAAIEARGGVASGHVCDATDIGALAPLIDEVVEAHGRLDILLNCQGINIFKPASEMTAEDYDTLMGINLRSVFFASQAAHARFRAQGGGGAIVNIASLSGHRGWPGAVVYGVSKHGVLGLTRSLAVEWADDGVRVNSISPGFFMTEINRDRMGEERKAKAMSRTPMNRFGDVEELVAAAVYLASDAARYVTGTDLAVDGGYLAAGI